MNQAPAMPGLGPADTVYELRETVGRIPMLDLLPVNLKCSRMRPRRMPEFSGLDQRHGLAAWADFMSAAGTLFPIAPWGLCSL